MIKKILFTSTLIMAISCLFDNSVKAQTPIFLPGMTITDFGSVNSPLTEGVEKIIDNDVNTKMLDFDLFDGMGFTVDLGGTSVVAEKIEITTANDAPGRDPQNFEIFGSNNGTSFVSIDNGTIPCITTRFDTRVFNFTNSTAYTHYRVDFTAQCNGTENSFQVAEVQLYTGCVPKSGSVTNTICNEGSIVVNGTTYDASNTSGIETIVDNYNCDSIVTVNLTVLPAITAGSVSNTICNNESIVINGTTYNAANSSGTETFSVGPNGCDSVVTVNLTVLSAFDVTVTNNSPSITANEAGAFYRWLDCDNLNAVISGETSQTFVATSNGNYAVEITIGSCVDTSVCENISTVGIKNVLKQDQISIYPNPTLGKFTIKLIKVDGNTTATVYNVVGKEIVRQEIIKNNTVIDLTDNSKGLYFVKIQNGGNAILTKRIIKQ